MAILTDYEEPAVAVAKPSAPPVIKQFTGVLDSSDPIGFVQSALEFAARESKLFESDSVVNEVSSLIRVVKEKVDEEAKKKRERIESEEKKEKCEKKINGNGAVNEKEKESVKSDEKKEKTALAPNAGNGLDIENYSWGQSLQEFDQRQKQMGLPTSYDMQKKDTPKKFMEFMDEDEIDLSIPIPLIEVFHIIYQGGSYDEDGLVPPEKQCGVIKICSICSDDVQYLYNVEVPDMSQPPIRFGDPIVMTVKGPTTPDSDDFYLKYDLFGGAYKGCVPICWEPGHPDQDFTRKIILNSTDGCGDVIVTTGQFADATVANLEVTLPNNSSGTKIYGVIAATNSKFDLPVFTSLLFHKKPENAIQVGDEGVIPLSKSHVAVPMKSVLHVDIFLNVNGDYRTASLCFDSKKEGDPAEDAKDIFKVKVTWYADVEKIWSLYDVQP